jgi:hypothetical protein
MKLKLSNFILPVRLFINRWLRRNLYHNLHLHHNLSPFLLLLFLLLSQTINAQVLIKERVEIKPQQNPSNFPVNINEHTFTYKLSWSPSEHHRGNIQITTCDYEILNSGWTTSGITTITVPGNGRHNCLFQEERYFYHNFYGWGWYSNELPDRLLQVFVDGVEKPHPQDFLGDENGLLGNFLFDIESFFCSADHAAISNPYFNQEWAWAECNQPGWMVTDPVQLTLIEGSQYATLYNTVTGTDLGHSVVLNNYTEMENIAIKPNASAPHTATPQAVNLEVNINGVIITQQTAYVPEVYSLIANAYPNRITTGEEAYLIARFYNFCATAPSEKKINAEIIKGMERGNLINPYTNERSKILTGLDHWYGEVGIDFIADGISPNSVDTVVIKFSSNDESIAPKHLSIYIKPPPIHVYTVPEVLLASDTAEVIIKKRNPDGTLEDFPAEQTFELAVTDECVNGNILVDTTLNIYFADAVRPIYFVTADSIEGGTGFVRLRVGTDLGGGISRPMEIREDDEKDLKTEEEIKALRIGYAKMIEQKKREMMNQMNKAGENLSPEGTIISACYFGDYLFNYGYWLGDVAVGGCDNWFCESDFEEYNGSIFIKDEMANYNGYNLCRYWNIKEGVAGFFPLFDKKDWHLGNGQFTEIKDQLIVPYQLDACYNKNEGYWQFSVLENSISLRAIIDVCESNIGYEHIIHNLHELNIIPNENTCVGLEDFEKLRDYKPIASKYYIYEMAWAHEKVHKIDFYDRIEEVLNYKFEYKNTTFTFKEWLTTAYQPECNELGNTKNKALYQAKKHYNEVLKEFVIRLKKRWDKFTHKGDELLHQKYEEDTHADHMVQWKITQYKKELQKRPSDYWKNCEFKEEND